MTTKQIRRIQPFIKINELARMAGIEPTLVRTRLFRNQDVPELDKAFMSVLSTLGAITADLMHQSKD